LPLEAARARAPATEAAETRGATPKHRSMQVVRRTSGTLPTALIPDIESAAPKRDASTLQVETSRLSPRPALTEAGAHRTEALRPPPSSSRSRSLKAKKPKWKSITRTVTPRRDAAPKRRPSVQSTPSADRLAAEATGSTAPKRGAAKS
jgi:hypothetical protein